MWNTLFSLNAYGYAYGVDFRDLFVIALILVAVYCSTGVKTNEI